jgi:hypothetical protein
MLLGIMERHQNWSAVIALVCGGQEINDGEAGLGEPSLFVPKKAENDPRFPPEPDGWYFRSCVMLVALNGTLQPCPNTDLTPKSSL